MIEADLSPRTGSRRFVYEVASRLLAAGHQVKVFTNKLDRKTCFKQLLTLPIEVVSSGESPLHFPRKTLPDRALKYYWGQAELAMRTSRRAADFSPDATLLHYTGERWLHPYYYHMTNPVSAVILNVLPPAAISDEPARYQLYNYTMPKMSHWRYSLSQIPYHLPPISIWEKASFEKLNLIIAHSKYVARKIGRHMRSNSVRKAIVPLAVNHSQFYPTWEEEPYFLFLGRIHPTKNIELLMYACKDLGSQEHLIIAGDIEPSFAWYKNKLEQLAARLGISNKVEIRVSPSQDELVHLMQACSIFLFPSLVDTFGMVVLEAMACGKPVVACKAGGVPELVNDTGFVLEPDAGKWSQTIRKLLSDSGFRRRLGKLAYERSKLFTWDRTSNLLVSVLQEACMRSFLQ
jgi:glycosyltransferase involved in cell wall biosynthesis